MREIELAGGGVALVDDPDLELIREFRWTARRNRYSVYAHTYIKGATVGMHCMIMAPPRGMIVDHINHDGLDNRRSNLRVCTDAQNKRNVRSFTGSSIYKGVSWDKRRAKWVANITTGRQLFLGYFEDEREAALAYDRAAIIHHGAFALMNILGTESEEPRE